MELSTSARLRQTQQDLAASQQDLTRVERERNEADAAASRWAERSATVLTKLLEARRDLDLARAELASARTELEQLRAAQQWIVARDGGRHCERCEQEIRRGEAYEEQPGTGGLIAHVRCPDTETEPTT